ncbi:urease accessory protein UreF [Phenylobacterium sp.]|jgi:urease accessory protein|uniref:urease accessory protein UreF n=1 Tax=Phenylobacterium sp. TaxID=1871053 RepID=UPI002F3ED4F5
MANDATGTVQDPGPLLHLFRLVSLSLPVGSFSYSRGLEAAVHAGWVPDEAAAQAWILGTLRSNFAALDGAMFCRMADALQAGDVDQFLLADARLAAGRESRELQAEDRRLGEALLRLLVELGAPLAVEAQAWVRTYPAAFAIAAGFWEIARFEALLGLLWAYVEGQAMAAVRLVPLGQTAAQRIMIAAVEPIASAAAYALSLPDDEIGATGQALAIASAWHEDQYSRLFQS